MRFGGFEGNEERELLDAIEEDADGECADRPNAAVVEAVQAFVAAKGSEALDKPLHPGNMTALQAAIAAGKGGIVPLLLAEGASADAHDKDVLPNQGSRTPLTPLAMAAEGGDEEMVRALLAGGATVNLASVKGHTPLLQAAMNGHPGVVGLLLSAEAAVDVQNDERCTPLIMAALEGHQDVVQQLLDAGADVNRASSTTPLAAAVLGRQSHVVHQLINVGADVGGGGLEPTPLFLATAVGEEGLVETLLAAGAKAIGMGLLSLACDGGHAAIVGLLLGAGVKADECREGETPLYISAAKGDAAIVGKLLEAGAAPDETKNGMTPLFVAAMKGHADAVTLLVKGGAEVDQASTEGLTPLQTAAAAGHSDTVKALLACGATVGQRGLDGVGGLHLAAAAGHDEVVRQLLAAGAPVHTQDTQGDTPLYKAARVGHSGVVNQLLAAGAIANGEAGAADGARALAKACSEGRSACVHELLTYRADVKKAIAHARRKSWPHVGKRLAAQAKEHETRQAQLEVVRVRDAKKQAVDLEAYLDGLPVVGLMRFVDGALFPGGPNARPRGEEEEGEGAQLGVHGYQHQHQHQHRPQPGPCMGQGHQGGHQPCCGEGQGQGQQGHDQERSLGERGVRACVLLTMAEEMVGGTCSETEERP